MYPNKPETIISENLSPLPPTSFPQGQWSTGLFDCWDDKSNCCITAFCPCITMGRIIEIVDKGTTSRCVGTFLYHVLSSVGCGWLYAYSYRSKLRRMFSLPEWPYSDLLTHCCCCLCGICQEYRELKNRDLDPAIGWEANVKKWKTEGVELPPINTMSR